MHGRKRATRAAVTPEESAKQRAKFGKLRALNKVALDCYKARDFSETSFDLTTKLLSVNPDAHTLWNFRRTILSNRLDEINKKVEGLEIDKLLEALISEEFSLTVDCIAKVNPKSYSTWYHRRWVVEHIGRIKDESGCTVGHRMQLAEELALCSKFLALDERNFHCWNYRSFIAKEKSVSSKEEMEFTTSLIERNFSNYSAWHKRTQVVNTNSVEELQSELELVSNAIFTEPADQTCWIYHQWLILRLVKKENIFSLSHVIQLSEEIKTIIDGQIQLCKDLLELEGESKWATFALVYLLKIAKSGDVVVDSIPDLDLELKALCLQLKEVDSLHSAIYDYLETTL